MDSHPHLTGPARTDLGDLAGFGRLYSETAGLIRSVLPRLGVREAAIDDATQDVFVVAYRRRAEFDRERPIAPWLVGIARRVAFRYRRSAARGERKLAALARTPEPPGEQLGALMDARHFLERFIAGLREERREVFILGEVYGLTGPEIAARLQIPVDTAYTRLRATRRQLEQALLAIAHDPAPTGPALHRGWLLLLPRLGEPARGTWLPLALGKAKLALAGIAVVATITAVAVVPDLRPPAPVYEPPATSRAQRVATMPATIHVAPLVPPPASRLEALLVAPPAKTATRTVRPTTPDPLGAALLATALATVARDPTAALALLDRHAREFPDTPLAEARALTRIRALCLLDDVARAREEAASLRHAGLGRDALAGTCVSDP